MIRMPAAIRHLPARMLLQVHDELVFEVEDSAVPALIEVARDIMQEAAMPAVHLDVPLIVDAGQGRELGRGIDALRLRLRGARSRRGWRRVGPRWPS